MKSSPSRIRNRAYTLIEALVAGSMLAVGVGAVASLSLAFVTQEEIAERTAKAGNYLENAAALRRVGVPADEISGLLPPEASVQSLQFSEQPLDITGLGPVTATRVRITWKPSAATEPSGTARWTGGSEETLRSASLDVISGDSVLPSPLPRVAHFE